MLAITGASGAAEKSFSLTADFLHYLAGMQMINANELPMKNNRQVRTGYDFKIVATGKLKSVVSSGMINDPAVSRGDIRTDQCGFSSGIPGAENQVSVIL